MIIYKIKLPAKQDPEAFTTFMRDEYFPAIHKGATRVGKVEGMKLVQGGRDGFAGTHDFYWLIEFGGLGQGEPRLDNDAVAAKFRTFGAKTKRMGFFSEVARWDGD